MAEVPQRARGPMDPIAAAAPGVRGMRWRDIIRNGDNALLSGLTRASLPPGRGLP